MQPGLQNILLITAITTTALSAGLLFAYSVSVNPGLAQLSDEAYVAAMQSINRAIQNPLFFLVYFSPLLLLPLSTWSLYKTATTNSFLFLLTATILYIVGVVGVTIAGNVPLNNALDAFNLKTVSANALKVQRDAFEIPWNRWHSIRTIAAVLSTVMALLSLVFRSELPRQ